MNIEDQVAVLFARANPVPSLDLLDPIDPVDIGALRDESERSSAMSEVKTIEPKREDSNRRRFAPGLALAGVMVVVAIAAFALANRNPTPVASPAETATSFLNARNSHDAETMTALLADDVVWVPGGELLMDATNIPAAVEFERITGADYEFTCANDGPSQVRCPYTLESDLSRALGIPTRARCVLPLRDRGRTDRKSRKRRRAANSAMGTPWLPSATGCLRIIRKSATLPTPISASSSRNNWRSGNNTFPSSSPRSRTKHTQRRRPRGRTIVPVADPFLEAAIA